MKKFRIIVVILFFVVSGIFYFWQIKQENKTEELPSSIFSQIEQEEIISNEKEDFVEDSIETKDVAKEEVVEDIFVHICGAVQKEGVYQLEKSSRLYMLIELAGGFTKEAAKDYHNLARIVEDGERIYILTKEELSQLSMEEQIEGEFQSEGLMEEKQRINLNTASIEELMTLSGIGESKANSIIEYRTKVGKFQSIEELMNISGIGEAMFEKIKNNVTIN